MKILARYIMTGANGVHLERVACTIDLEHATVELLHPTASVFEENSAVVATRDKNSPKYVCMIDACIVLLPPQINSQGTGHDRNHTA